MTGIAASRSSPFRRAVSQMDWLLVLATILLSLTGIYMIYSAIHSNPIFLKNSLHLRQALWSSIGLCVLLSILFFDYHFFTRWAYLFYALVIVLLIAVLFTGQVVGGSKRWLVFGPLRLQPSELARLAVILVLARYFGSREEEEPMGFKELIPALLLVLAPVLLIVRQPDLGTGLTVFLIAGVMALAVGVKRRVLITIGTAAVACAPLGWFFLKEYQRRRILTLFNPDADPLGAGYQSMQSIIAVGSGEIWGKGLLQGTQSRLHFLPEKHTDFIFSVLSEELGFIGSITVLALFFIFILRCLSTALNAADKEGALLAVGITTAFFLYVIFNIGMTLGLMPIVGIPLPLVSYGGSASISSFIAIGLVLNVGVRRKSLSSMFS